MDDDEKKLEMWLAAKVLWENTPDITDSQIIASLQPHYGDLVPTSNGTYSKKRSKERWVKKNPVKPKPRIRKKVEKKPPKVEKLTPEMENETGTMEKKWKNGASELVVFSAETNKAENMEKSATLENVTAGFEEILDSIVLSAKDRAKIIVKHRKRWEKQGFILDSIMEISTGLLEDVDDPSADADAIQKKIAVLGIINNTLDITTRANKIISEVEMPLCGITADDFQQSAQDIRLNALSHFSGIDEEERLARDRLKPELFARLRELEQVEASDDFGREDMNPSDPLDDNIDDVDYTYVEDDE